MRVWIPPGTVVQRLNCRVTVMFHREQDAVGFCEWLKWLDRQPSGSEMVIRRPEDDAKPQ